MTRPIYASIDVDALQHNLLQVRKLAPDSKVMAVLKADAYGHGLLTCSHALSATDSFGLLDLSDAVTLRKAGFKHPICLLEGFFSKDELPEIGKHNLEIVIHSNWQLDILEDISQELELNAWLKIDTGMNRLGFTPEQVKSALQRVSNMNCISNIFLMSHLANADQRSDGLTPRQLNKFIAISEDMPGSIRSIANSAGILAHPDCHLDWVRPGIMLYGSSPFRDATASSLNLQPVMSLNSEIISIKDCKKNDAVGYGGNWRCPVDMRIGVVACGYGDGYPRLAPTGMPLMVAGKMTQLIGRVSMDMMTVDLRGIDAATEGSPVELWGENISVDTVAERVGTISYELLCGVTARVTRKEMHNG